MRRVSASHLCAATSSCTATRRTRSSTARPCRRSSPPAAELGYEALALTDHDGVYGSLEFAHAAKLFGVRPSPAPRSRWRAALTSRCSSRPRAATRTSAGCSPPRTRSTRPKPMEPRAAAGARPARSSTSGNEGLVCLSGCARHGLAVRNPNAAARVARAFGRDRFFVELQRPYERGDARRNARAARPRRVARRPHRRHRRRARPPPERARLQDVLVAIRNNTSLEGCEPERRGNHEACSCAPAEAAERFPHDRDAVDAHAASSPSGSASTSPRSSATATPTSPTATCPPTSSSPASATAPSTSATAALNGHKRRAREPLDEELALIDRDRPLRLLPPPLGGARARPRVRARGARHRLAAPRAAARPRPRQLRRLDRLLPDRPVARRPGRRRPLARPLPQPRAARRPRHRPRLPARHPREAHRPRHRALRPRARGARLQLRRPTARAAPSATSARRSASRTPSSSGSRALSDGWNARRVRRGARRSSRTRSARLDSPRWRAFGEPAARSPACRATSPSTPAAWSSRRGRSSTSSRCSPRRWPAGRSASGTRTRATTPASSRSTCSASGCSPPSRTASSRSRACAASRSTSRASRSTTTRSTARSARPTPSASSRSRAARRCRSCCARGPRTSTTSTSQVALVRPGPIQGKAVHPYIEHRAAAARGPVLRRRRSTTRCSPSRSATRSASSSSRTRCSRWRWRSPGSPSARPRRCAAR